tara:strand:- start:165 stop:332 length:168 start_codon:yes stop_codon:yes gene_type:complete
MFLYLRKPRRIHVQPVEPREERQDKVPNNYPDYEQSFVFEETHEPENNHVTGIDI